MARTTAKNGIKRVGIITKHNIKVKANAEFFDALISGLKKYGVELLLDENSAPLVPKAKTWTKSKILRRADLVLVLGGDGTLLKTAREVGYARPLIAGVNMGHLGFLTGFTIKKLLKSLPKIFAKKFDEDERFLLRVTIYRNGKKRFTTLALNEAVINQGGFSRLINMHVEVNKRMLANYRADGIIISTPTGSTGHSLSAYGPIVHPSLDSFLLVPLCPIKLGVRPIIIPNNRLLTLRLETQWRAEKKPIVLTVDGQITKNLKRGDTISVRKSKRTFRMIRMKGHNYYRMLRHKLNWGE